MELLVASHDLYPDPGSGGTGRYVYETGRRLADRGHDVTVLTRRRGDVPARETVAGMDVFRFEFELAGRPGPAVLADVPGTYRIVARFADGREPDLVSFQGQVESLFLDPAIDDAVPRSCTFHSPWPAEYRLQTADRRAGWRRRVNAAVRAALESRVVSRADELLTLSDAMRDRLEARYEPAAETAVVPGGVDPVAFAPDAGRYEPIAGDGRSFLTVRRLSPRMGHESLLAAFARVRRGHPEATLYVAGDGALRERLEARAESLGVADRTTFLGYVPDEELPAAYATADVFVLPTRDLEGFGLATLEALASGTPAIGTPVGGTVELLGPCQDEPAIPAPMLAAAADADALAERMAAWADLDDVELRAAGRACHRFARQRYPWTKTVDRLEARYGALVDGRPSRPATGDAR